MNDPPLPSALKRVTVIALLLSGLLGFGAAQSMAQVLEPPDPAELDFGAISPLPFFEQNPELFHSAARAFVLAQLAGYESMRSSRTVILISLSVMSALVFVSALRMLRPRGAPREGVRQLLATATLVTAVLRTLEGAQSAAVAKRAGGAFDQIASASRELAAEYPEGFMAVGVTAVSIVFSLLVGGGLVLLTLYYRSERVREITTGLDGPASSS